MGQAQISQVEIADTHDKLFRHWVCSKPSSLHILSKTQGQGCWELFESGRKAEVGSLSRDNIFLEKLCESYHLLISSRFGTAFSFLTQITLAASVWSVYTQWLWRTVRQRDLTVSVLNAAFEADLSVLSLLNLEMLKKMRLGWVMALFAWSVWINL
jgi:hypothetical protein